MSKILSIIILAYNKYNFTASCLKDLSYLPNDHEIIVFDNASSDETKSKLEGSKEITYIRSEENIGFGRGNNIAYNLTSAPNVMFLNNDIRVNKNKDCWTQDIIKYCDDYIVGPTMGLLDKEFNFIKEDNKYLEGLSYMSGWNISSSKNNWNKLNTSNDPNVVKVFDEDFPFYFEDTNLSFSARKLGIPFKVIDIPVVHFGKISSKQLNVAKLYTEARKIFVNKWKNKI